LEKNKIKVVWLCHFANEEVKQYFGTPLVNEFAPWIGKMLELFKQSSVVEIHVVAPNVFTNVNIKFSQNGINYNFYPIVPSVFNGSFLNKIYQFARVDYFSGFFWIKRKVSAIIDKIEPDIIHLHGAENPYYSAAILPLFNKYTVLTTIQGFIRNSTYMSFDIKRRITIEERVIKKSIHLGVRTNEMIRIVTEINPGASLHFHNYPMDMPSISKDNFGGDEPIDCLFFARIDKDKGIEDLLNAIAILKKRNPILSLSVIGASESTYLTSLKEMCKKLDISDNVRFLGFLPSEEDIYPYILQSKICILPTYHDILPGTILLSMFMKLPVVSYDVGGIPELNRDGKTVTLVKKGDIVQLSEEMFNLLNNCALRKDIAEKGYVYSHNRFNNKNVVVDVVNIYKKILQSNALYNAS
jgi:glycosyltransferase involved in cell wall biosynthesis